MIEEAKFTYSPLGKAFDKQIKTIENQDEKQIKAIEEPGKQLVESNVIIKKHDYDTEKDSSSISRQKEIFNNLIDGRPYEILKVNQNIIMMIFCIITRVKI